MASTRTASTRASRKTADAGAAQAANAAGLEQVSNPAPTPAPQATAPQASGTNAADNKDSKPTATAPTNDANLVVPRVSHTLLVQAIKGVTNGFKAAICSELAVCIAVFHASESTSKDAKKELYSVFKDAGFDCEVGGGGKDYKTVNRRIGYAADFYNSLEKEPLTILLGEFKDEQAMKVLEGWLLTKYNFRSMSDVIEASGKTPPSRQPRNTGDGGSGGTQQPQGGAQEGQQGTQVFGSTGAANPVTAPPQGGAQPDAGDKGVMAAMQQASEQREGQQRRESDDTSRYVRHTYEGATIIVPVDYKVACLHELGVKLIQAAAHMRGDKVDAATLTEQFKEAVANH